MYNAYIRLKNTHDTQEVQELQTALNTQEESKTQETHNTLDTQEVYKAQHTQGRKGQKLKRINMAFSDDNLEYLQLIGRIEGVSMTEYVNRVVAADHEARGEEVAEAKRILRGNK